MSSLNDLIFDLLVNNDCVVLPDFGAFISQNQKAKINRENGTISPPSKRIGFNPKLTNNDGLLVSAIAKHNKSNYSEATTIVKKYVEDLSKKLNEGNRIEINKVGVFYLDKNKNIFFEQDDFSNVLLSSYGLKEVQVTKAIKTETLQKPKKTLTSKITLPSKEEKINENKLIIENSTNKSKAWRYIAAACLLPIIFYSFWIPINSDLLESGVLSFSDLNPFHDKVTPKYKTLKQQKSSFSKNETRTINDQIKSLDSNLEFFSYEFDNDHYIMVNLKKKEKSSKINETKEEIILDFPKDKPAKNSIKSGTKNPIAGCFKKKSNAKRLVKKLIKHGFDAFIIDINNGLHRVTIGNASNSNQLKTLIQKADSLGYRTWILKN